MSSQAQVLTRATPGAVPLRPGTVLRRKCRCGGGATAGGECSACREKKKQSLQRKGAGSAAAATVPAAVHDVLRSPGQPLDPAARAFLEPRFGHDFSRVRVHSDDRAANSAREVDALAYAAGQDVVFGAGQYAPGTSDGRRLLAHELAHVIQQTARPGGDTAVESSAAEGEAEGAAQRVMAGEGGAVQSSVAAGTVQRQATSSAPAPTPAPTAAAGTKDQAAIDIITYARGQKASPQTGAVETVKKILSHYYPGDAAKVKDVVFDENKAGGGLSTDAVQDKATKTYVGIIYVGSAFLDAVATGGGGHFAHRVLQVGHELEHIEQHRQGMVGPGKSCEREFLAFLHEALAVEKPGSGMMLRPQRVEIIDVAIGYYNCLDSQGQKNYSAQRQQLQARRDAELIEIKNRNYPTMPAAAPPSACTPAPGAPACQVSPPKKHASVEGGATEAGALAEGGAPESETVGQRAEESSGPAESAS